jgi:hypothetical protein
LVVRRHPTSAPTAVGAERAVARANPDALVTQLLTQPLYSNEVPAGVKSAIAPQLFSVRFQGLVASLETSFNDPTNTEQVNVAVFADPVDASAFFRTSTAGAEAVAVPGVSDPSRCLPLSSPTPAAVCEVLSNRAVVVAVATHKGGGPNEALEETLALDGLRHLARVAALAGHHPRHSTVVAPGTVVQRLEAASTPAWLPAQLTSPTSYSNGPGSYPPTGLVDDVETDFNGPDHLDSINYYVFDSSADATTWYQQGLGPPGAMATSPFDSSGFAQPAACGDYASPGLGVSSCFVLDGDTVIESFSSSTTDATGANDTLTATMARIAVIRLDLINGAP